MEDPKTHRRHPSDLSHLRTTGGHALHSPDWWWDGLSTRRAAILMSERLDECSNIFLHSFPQPILGLFDQSVTSIMPELYRDETCWLGTVHAPPKKEKDVGSGDCIEGATLARILRS